MIPIRFFLTAIPAAIIILCVGSSGSFAQSASERPPAPPVVPGVSPPTGEILPATVIPRTLRTLDLVVTITMSTGKSETFAREVDRLEIITFRDGRIAMVHLVIVAGGERNTHVWYNFSRIAKLSYRFVTPEGRNRVQVRVIQPSVPTQDIGERLEPLSPREFR